MTMSPQIHPSGFRISDKPVAASFAHPYSFQPLPDHALRDEACLLSTPSLGGMEGVYVRYWDEASTAAILEFKVEEPVAPAATPAVKEKEKKKKAKGIRYRNYVPGVLSNELSPAGENETNAQATAAASVLPLTDKPVTLNFKGTLGNKAPSSSTVSALPPEFSMADEGESAEGEEEQLAPGDPKGLSCGMRSIRFLGGTLTFSICSFCIEESGTAHRE